MHLIAFAIRTLPAEVKNNWQRSLIIILCLAVGIASVAAVKIYTDSALSYFTGNVKEFVGADITVQLPGELTEDQENFLNNQTLGIITYVENYNQVAFNPFNRQKNMPVQVTVIDPEVYPLYGSMELADGSSAQALLDEPQAALVSASLFEQLELKMDNLVLVGNVPYIVRGILKETSVPDGFMGRIYTKTPPQEGVGTLGSRFAYIKLDEGKDPEIAKKEILEFFEPGGVSTYVEVSSQISRSAKVLGNVALIASLASLLLGGLGVSNVAQVISRQKLKQSALMKCVGGRTSQITLIIVIQIAFIGLIGVLCGFVLGWALTGVLPGLLKDLVSYNIPIKPNPNVFLQVSLLGLLVTVLFSVLPVLRFTKIRPLAIYRDDNPERLLSPESKLTSFLVIILLAGIFGLFIGLILDSLLAGIIFTFATLILTAIALGIIKLIIKLVLYLPIYFSTPAKMARRSLFRQSGRTAAAVLALSFGISAIVLISFIQTDVLSFMHGLRDDQNTPNIFALLDQQNGPPVESIVEFMEQDSRIESFSTMKLLTSSLEIVNDRLYDPTTASDSRSAILAMAFLIAAADPENMPTELNYVEGEPLNSDGQIVIEEHVAKSLGLKIGDRLGLRVGTDRIYLNLVGFYSNMQTGVNVTSSSYATKASLEGLSPEFSTEFLFARTKAGVSGEEVISSLRAAYPNMGFAFDVGQLINLFDTVFSAISRFMQFLGFFALASGLIILAGTMVLTKWEKRRETALIRCLGGTTKDVISVQLWENGVLGILSAGIGITFANILSMVINRYVLDIDFVFNKLTNTTAFVLVLLAVTAVGAVSLWDVLHERPLSVLRNE